MNLLRNSLNRLAASRAAGRSARRAFGFTVLEMMVVITIILLLLSVAIPNYRNSIVRSKESVLKDHLFTLRSLIDQYTLDKKKGPESLDDLVSEGYLREVPVDPITNSNTTWQTDTDSGSVFAADQTSSGIVDVHSGAPGESLDGSPYSSW